MAFVIDVLIVDALYELGTAWLVVLDAFPPSHAAYSAAHCASLALGWVWHLLRLAAQSPDGVAVVVEEAGAEHVVCAPVP